MAIRRRWLKPVLITAFIGLVIFGVVLAGRGPKRVDLTALASLHPKSKQTDKGGWIEFRFAQPMRDVERILDARLNNGTGWEAGGADDLDYVWYHREGWRTPFYSVLSDLGLHDAFLSLKSDKPSGSRLTVLNGDGSLILP